MLAACESVHCREPCIFHSMELFWGRCWCRPLYTAAFLRDRAVQWYQVVCINRSHCLSILGLPQSKTHSMATKNIFLAMLSWWSPNERSYGKYLDSRCVEQQSYQGYGGYLNSPFTYGQNCCENDKEKQMAHVVMVHINYGHCISKLCATTMILFHCLFFGNWFMVQSCWQIWRW